MGGCCCCASRSTELQTSPPYFHYPVSEEHEPLSGHHARVSALSTGFLVDTNLDTSIPDTYQPPPAPIPYERYVGQLSPPSENRGNCGSQTNEVRQPNNTESTTDTYSGSTLEATVEKLESDEKTKLNPELEPTEEVMNEDLDDDLKKPVQPLTLQDEEDVCPTCFEEYDEENPKIITKCDHHFHLACILEWKERSDTCPVCDQEMVFSPVAAAGG